MNWDYTTIFCEVLTVAVRHTIKELGQNGWELAGMNNRIMVFKRPIIDNELKKTPDETTDKKNESL